MRIPKRKIERTAEEEKALKQEIIARKQSVIERAEQKIKRVLADDDYDEKTKRILVSSSLMDITFEQKNLLDMGENVEIWNHQEKMAEFFPVKKESLIEVTQEEADEMDAEELDRLFETREVEATAYDCIMYKNKVLADGSPVYKVMSADENGNRETCLFNSLEEAKDYAKTFFYADIFGGRYIKNKSVDMESMLSETWETYLIFFKGELKQNNSKYFFMNLEYFKDN